MFLDKLPENINRSLSENPFAETKELGSEWKKPHPWTGLGMRISTTGVAVRENRVEQV